MSFSNIYWKACCYSSGAGQGRKEEQQEGSGVGLPLLSGNLGWQTSPCSTLAQELNEFCLLLATYISKK